jgi:hypothetical protein
MWDVDTTDTLHKVKNSKEFHFHQSESEIKRLWMILRARDLLAASSRSSASTPPCWLLHLVSATCIYLRIQDLVKHKKRPSMFRQTQCCLLKEMKGLHMFSRTA